MSRDFSVIQVEVKKAVRQAIMSRYRPVPECYRSPLLNRVKTILNEMEIDQELLGQSLLKKS